MTMKYMVTLNGKNYEIEVEHGEAVLLRTSDVTSASVSRMSLPRFLFIRMPSE